MSNAQQLKDLINNEVLPEINECIDDLFAIVAEKTATEDDIEELKQLQLMQKEFKDMLKDIDSGEMEEAEYEEIIQSINDMMNGEDSDDDVEDDEE